MFVLYKVRDRRGSALSKATGVLLLLVLRRFGNIQFLLFLVQCETAVQTRSYPHILVTMYTPLAIT